MANAFITRAYLDNGNVVATVSVQSDADPLTFANYTVRLPNDAAWQAMTRQQKIAAIFAQVRTQIQTTPPPPDLGLIGQGTV